MNTSNAQSEVTSRTSEERLDQACAWVARLRSDEISPSERHAFAAWLTESAENQAAFDEIAELWGDLGALSNLPLQQLFPDTPLQSATATPAARASTTRQSETSWTLPQWITGGAMAAACLVVAVWVGNQWLPTGKNAEQVYITAVGETETLELADGTLVQLNTNSELRVSYSRNERRTQLTRGEAFFDVARQTARPFTVSAGTADIRVLGTEFNVERNANNTRVSVTGGIVSVSESREDSTLAPESVKLKKNQKVTVSSEGISKVRPTSADEALDWTRGVLVFEETPLEDALEELNRYLDVPAAAAPSVADRQLSGTFELSDPNNTLKAIAAALDLYEDTSAPNLTLLSPPPN